MITNEKQYRVTHPRLLQARQDQMRSQLEEFREDLGEYEALWQGRVKRLEVKDLSELPAALIRARVAAGLTQAQLAGRLNIKTQQVQRDEAKLYCHVSFERMAKVAEALGVRLRGEVALR